MQPQHDAVPLPDPEPAAVHVPADAPATTVKVAKSGSVKFADEAHERVTGADAQAVVPARPAVPLSRPTRPAPLTAASKTAVVDIKTPVAEAPKPVVRGDPKPAAVSKPALGKVEPGQTGKPKFVISVVSARPMNAADGSAFGPCAPPPPEDGPKPAADTVVPKPVKPAAAAPAPPVTRPSGEQDPYPSTSDSSDGEGVDISATLPVHHDDEVSRQQGPAKPRRTSKEKAEVGAAVACASL